MLPPNLDAGLLPSSRSRIAHLLAHDKADPTSILAITFTKKATEEIQNRVCDFYPPGQEPMGLTVKTFHSFARTFVTAHWEKMVSSLALADALARGSEFTFCGFSLVDCAVLQGFPSSPITLDGPRKAEVIKEVIEELHLSAEQLDRCISKMQEDTDAQFEVLHFPPPHTSQPSFLTSPSGTSSLVWETGALALTAHVSPARHGRLRERQAGQKDLQGGQILREGHQAGHGKDGQASCRGEM